MAEAGTNLIEVLIVGVDQASKQLADVQARLSGLEKAAGTASTSSEVLNTAWKGLGSTTATVSKAMGELTQVAGALGITGFGPLTQSTSLVVEGFTNAVASAGTLMGALTGVGAVIGVVGTAAALLSKHFADLGMEMNRAHQQTGISLEDLSGIKVAAESVDVAFGNIEFSLRIFNRTLGQAAAGSREARDVFADLKISEDEIATGLANPGALLELTAKRIMALQSAAQQTEVEFRLFGRGGRDMTLVLQELADKGLEAARKKAEELGLMWNEQMVADAKKFNDSINSVSERLKGFVILLGSEVLPVMQNFLDYWAKIAGLQVPKLPSVPEEQLKSFQTALEREQKILELMKQGATVRPLFPGEQGKVSIVPLPTDAAAQQAKVDALKSLIGKLQTTANQQPVQVKVEPTMNTAQARALAEIKAKMEADADKASADALAARQRAIFEQTGNTAALEASFRIQLAATAKAADAARDAEIKKLKESMPGLPAADEARIRALADQQKAAQLDQIRLERSKALFQVREQGQATDIAQLKQLETEAKNLAEAEQARLDTLKQQQASVGEQDAQLLRVQDAQQHLLEVQIDNRQKQIALIGEQIIREGLVGDKLKAAQIQQGELTGELVKFKTALDELGKGRDTNRILQERKNLIVDIEQENRNLQEIEDARGKRAIQVQEQEVTLRKQIKDLNTEAAIAGITDETKRQIAEVNAKYQEQRDAINDLIQLYPELEDTALKALDAINKANKTAVDNINTNKNALVQMAQSLSDAFVNSMDRAFDEVLSGTEDFGKRMQNLVEDIGKTILKSILHSLITVPIKESLDTSIAQLRKSIASGGGILSMFGIGGAAVPTMPGTGEAIATGAAAKSQNLPVPDFTDWTFTIDKGMSGVSKTMTEGLTNMLDKAAGGFGDFFGSLTKLISSMLQSISEAMSDASGKGFSLFRSILGIFSSVVGMFSRVPGATGGAPGSPGLSPTGEYAPGPTASDLASYGGGLTQRYAMAQAIPQSFLQPFQQTAAPTRAATATAGVGQAVAVQQQQAPPQVIIQGDVVPRDPGMRPSDVIKIVYNDMDRGGMTSKATVNVLKRNR
jgi:hypothetical protein